MNKIIFLIPFCLFFLSCNNDENEQIEQIEQIEEQVTACFEVSNEALEIGEELQITNCSVGASSYEFNFGNGTTSNEDSPLISYEIPGDYTITLKVISDNGKINTTTKNIKVNEIEGNYIYPSVLEGDWIVPINFGYANNSFYYIEYYSNVFINHSRKYNYVEVDLTNNTFTKTFLSNKVYGSLYAFLNTLNNDETLIYTVQSMPDRIGLTEIKLNSSLQTQSTEYNSWRVLYGLLEDNTNYLYYGSYRNLISTDPDFSFYKSPSIEIRNSLGKISERKTYNIIEQGFIGDLKKSGNGFIAFGGITDPTAFSTFENYRPLIIFLDNNYEYINHITYSNTSISATNNNSLNGSFHLEKLTNNSYVLYSHNEFRIINSNGNEIIKVTLPEQDNTQGLVAIENEGFILSSKDYIRKYDLNGSLVKSLRFNGRLTPNLILNDNKIFFASGYNSNYYNNVGVFSVLKTFIGAIDTELNIINLN